MRRVLFRLLGVALFTWLNFSIYPGHTYLHAGTQLTVPMLERLRNPGYLSRDLVATHANLEYTAYDETTLFLHDAARISVEDALLAQQVASRAAGLLGILLLGVSAGLGEFVALTAAACISLGATLAGPNLMVVDPEAVPRALAWGPILLAIGLLAREKPLLGGLAGGVALIYDPSLAAPFCVVVIVAQIMHRRSRRLFRPSMTVLAVFVLLLANLAQLQPGIEDRHVFFEKISDAYAAVQRFRTPSYWVSLWPHGDVWSYVFVWICGIWATVRIWPVLKISSRWFLIALPTWGIVSLAASWLMLDHLHWSLVPLLEPAQWLSFTFALSSVACWIAAVHATRAHRSWESALWLLLPFSVLFRAEVLHVLRFVHGQVFEYFCIAAVLAGVAALVIRLGNRQKLAPATLIIPLLATGALQLVRPAVSAPRQVSTTQLAEWVRQNTWGSSMFFFADLGRGSEPGIFRALSLRPVWADWNSGALVPFSPSFAATWWERWQHTLRLDYSAARLETDLSLPIDYYVLTRANQLANVKPVYTNDCFVVYDANDLRNHVGPLSGVPAR
jgi:hypothetical protein